MQRNYASERPALTSPPHFRRLAGETEEQFTDRRHAEWEAETLASLARSDAYIAEHGPAADRPMSSLGYSPSEVADRMAFGK